MRTRNYCHEYLRLRSLRIKQRFASLFILPLIAGCLPQIEGCPGIGLDGDPGITDSSSDQGSTSGPASFDGAVRSGIQRVGAAESESDLQSRSGNELRFSADSASVQNAVAGELVLFEGVAGGRVVSVEDDGEDVVVTLEDVPLTEFIENGSLTWDKTLQFSESSQPEVLPGFEDSFSMVASDTQQMIGVGIEGGELTSFTFSGELNGFDVTVTLRPTSGRLDVEMTLRRSAGSREVYAATVTGFVENIRQLTDLEIVSGTTERAQIELKDLSGEVEIVWSAFNPGQFFPDELFQMQIPVVIPFRFAVGPIPVTVKIGILGRVLAQLTVEDMSSRGSLTASFNGEGGVAITETSVQPLGGGGVAHELGQTGENTTAGAVTTALSMGVQFPHIEVGILLDSAKAFLTVDTFVTGFFEPGLLSNVQPCQSVEIKNKGVAGYSVSLLGLVDLGGSQQELWVKEQRWVSEGSSCDE
jgi:hypothetical protein